jgi:Ribbon-helix-helix domain
MKQLARWTLTVSSDVDRRVRRHLAEAGRKGDLSVFVEEAVRARLQQLSMRTERNMSTQSVPTSDEAAEAAEADRILSATYSRPSANDVERPAADESSQQIGDENYGDRRA